MWGELKASVSMPSGWAHGTLTVHTHSTQHKTKKTTKKGIQLKTGIRILEMTQEERKQERETIDKNTLSLHS